MAGWKDKRKVMQRYDLTAEMYEERYAEEQEAKYRAALENVDLAGGGFWMWDAAQACFSAMWQQKRRHWWALMFHANSCLKLRNKHVSFENVFVLQADADHLPFREKFFDFVFAFTVLQNMPKPAETLNELKRVAKQGGKVVVTGLKKAFPLNAFMDVLESSGLKLVSFVDDEDLKCYVAVLAA